MYIPINFFILTTYFNFLLEDEKKKNRNCIIHIARKTDFIFFILTTREKLTYAKKEL